MPELWEIVGGADQGGIIVREEAGLRSAMAPARLGQGAIVEEVKLAGTRLKYNLVEGKGPLEGWISVVLNAKTLAKRIGFYSPAQIMQAQAKEKPKPKPQPTIQKKPEVSKIAEALKHEDAVTELSEFPKHQLLSDDEVIAFCKLVVPAWSDLSDSATVTCSSLAGGLSSLVMLLQVDVDVSPKACVYAYQGSSDAILLQEQTLLSIQGSKAGAAPWIYAAIGKHRVMEYVDGHPAFGGLKDAHFLSTYDVWDGSLVDSPGNSDLMEHIGRAVGQLHATPLDVLARALGLPEFQSRLSNPTYFPRTHMHFSNFVGKILVRVMNSKAIPREGLFEKPVVCHGDLHAGNILMTQRDARIIDWETVCLGHRGMDLAYFFLCAPGANISSRRAFAKAYLEVQHKKLEAEAVDGFLLDVARCFPLGLVYVTTLSVALRGPQVATCLLEYTQAVLDALEAEEDLVGRIGEDVLNVGFLKALHENNVVLTPDWPERGKL